MNEISRLDANNAEYEVIPGINLKEDELIERFVRSSGPGGQNVNKVSSACELRFDLELGVLDALDDVLGLLLVDALLERDLLPRRSDIALGVGQLRAAHVDTPCDQPRLQDFQHLLELVFALPLHGDHEFVQFEGATGATEVEAIDQFAIGLVDRIADFLLVAFGNDVEGGHGRG